MKITTLIDNTTRDDKLYREFGLSMFIDFKNTKILFDTGYSEKFIKNAQYLKIDISEVSELIFSHFHSDHTGGLTPFLEENTQANIFIPRLDFSHLENFSLKKYKTKQLISEERERFMVVEGVEMIAENIYAVSYYEDMQATDLSQSASKYCPELALILKEDNELVVISGCSHHGIIMILERIKKTFNKKIKAVIGGFHLFDLPENLIEKEAISISKYLLENKISKIYTGHCTGDKGGRTLKENLGDNLAELYAGLSIEL